MERQEAVPQQPTPQPRLLVTLSCYLLQGIFVASLVTWTVGFHKRSFSVPVNPSGDALHHLMVTKMILEEGWWWRSERVSAPFGLDMIAFPVGGNVDYACIRLLGQFSSDPARVLNAFWLLSVVFAGWTAAWSLRRLTGSLVVSLIIGTLYAVIPHVFYRHTSHLMLVTYLVPPVCLAGVRLAAGTFGELSRLDKALVGLCCVLVGCNYIYTAFFACFVLLVAALIAGLTRQWRMTLAGMSLIVLTTISAALNFLPTYLMLKRDPAYAKIHSAEQKQLLEADIHALPLRVFFYSRADHPIKPLRKITQLCQQPGMLSHSGEGRNGRPGLVGAVGLVVLLGGLLLRAGRTGSGSADAHLYAAGGLLLGCLVLASSGGLNMIVNILVGPYIRCYNRISIFTSFLCLFAVAYLLSLLRVRLAALRGGKVGFGLVLAIVLVFGLVDQLERGVFARLRALDPETQAYRAFTREAESRLPEGSMVFQYPYVGYPYMWSLDAYDFLKPVVWSKKVRWSFPSISTRAIEMHQRIESLVCQGKHDEAVRELIDLGFSAIYIDRRFLSHKPPGTLEGFLRLAGGTPLPGPGGHAILLELSQPKRPVASR